MTKSITVIGGGVAGLSSAWRLAEEGWDVTLLEKDVCGSGASKASLGALMPYGPWQEGDLPQKQRECLFHYPKFVAKLFQYTGVDPQYRPLGRLQPIHSEKQYHKMHEASEMACNIWPWRGIQNVQEVLSPEQLEKIEPELNVSEFGALMCRLTAHINPYALIAGLRSACMRSGVDIRENCPVDSLKFQGERVYELKTGFGPLPVENILIAGGAWSSKLLPDLGKGCEIYPVKGQALLLHSESVKLRHLIRGFGLYVVPLGNGRFWVGATKEKEKGFDTSLTQEAKEKIMDKVDKLIPELSLAKVEKHWCGFRPHAETGKPLVEKVDVYNNVFMISGHGGIGICMAPSMGEDVVNLLRASL